MNHNDLNFLKAYVPVFYLETLVQIAIDNGKSNYLIAPLKFETAD